MLYLIELVIIVGISYFYITQFVMPIRQGEPVFPLFWSKERKLREKERRIEQKIQEAYLEEDVKTMEKQLEELRKSKDKDESN